jgi:DNA polymerase family A
MRVCVDIECNSLNNPTKIWLVVCKDIDTSQLYIFRNVHEDASSFMEFTKNVTDIIGHNVIGYDLPALASILGFTLASVGRENFEGFLVFGRETCVCDTLVVSRLVDYSRPDGHSIEAYGEEFGLLKGKFSDWTKWSQEMEDYCVRDVEICHRIYLKYLKYISDPRRRPSIELEQQFQLLVNTLSNNGFAFNTNKAKVLLDQVDKELAKLDLAIKEEFPAKLKLVREITPKVTKHGTLSRTDFRFVQDGDLSIYNGGPFSRCVWSPFNPASHKQIIEVLNASGWSPEEKTETHKEVERELHQLKYRKHKDTSVDKAIEACDTKLRLLKTYGFKINEHNLNTLPENAPGPARTLAKRILYESRRRTLTEWLGLVNCEIRINKDSAGFAGITEKENETLSGVSDNITAVKNGGKIILKNQGPLTEEATSNILTDYRSKTLINFLKSKKVDAYFVKENGNYLWITVTGQEKLEVFCAILATETLAGANLSYLQYKITSERINGQFYGLGSWTGRMAHQRPNTANIPREFHEDGTVKFLGKEMRQLWCAPKRRLLVGVDAEGIQLRIFAHYIDDEEFTNALVRGKKSEKTDPHSLNQRILGDVCKSRQAAKRFVYALLLGGGIGKLAQILGCTEPEAREALDRLLQRYTGFAYLKKEVIPKDGKRGFFEGLDGRLVRIPGDTASYRNHLCMSGYLQNGEAVIMKKAALLWHKQLKDIPKWYLVNMVHDEWQTEVPNDMEVAIHIAKTQAESLRIVGEELKLKCPLAGSYWNEDINDYTIGTNWFTTH